MKRPWRFLVAVAFSSAVVACAQPSIIPDEPFRNFVPASAELTTETADDGRALIADGERSVLRVYDPRATAAATDVLAEIVEEGARLGWEFSESTDTRAIGTKEIDGRPWMVSVVVVSGHGPVRQLFAGR